MTLPKRYNVFINRYHHITLNKNCVSFVTNIDLDGRGGEGTATPPFPFKVKYNFSKYTFPTFYDTHSEHCYRYTSPTSKNIKNIRLQ